MKYFFFAILLFATAYLVPISGRPLQRPDEFRYGEIPREMLLTGDFTTPRLLQARYFEKPVLGYWLIAGSLRLCGENRFALRLPMALATALTALLLGLWVKRVSRDAEWARWAATFHLATGLAWMIGTTALLDGIFALFTTATLLCAHQAVTTEKWDFERLIWLVLCGVSAGLGFMTKGFVAWALPGLAAVAWLLWTRRFKTLLWLPWIPLLATAATVAPWAYEIHRAEPDFWHYFVVVEHLQRFKSSEATQHPEPFWYYLPVLIGTLFPALFTVLHGAAAGKATWKKIWENATWRFALCAMVLPFLFLSASKGKLATYILPCYPFAAVLLTLPALEALRGGRREALLTLRMVFDILGAAFAAAGAAGIAFGLALLPPVDLGRFVPIPRAGWWYFIIFGAVAAASGMWLIRARRGTPRRRIAGFFVILAPMLALTMPVFRLVSWDTMPEADLRALAASGEFSAQTAHLFTYGAMGHAVAWTFRRPDTRLLFSVGEMEYGAKYARQDGRPLLWTYSKNGEFDRLIRDPKRKEAVVYIALGSEVNRYRGKFLLSLKPRRVERGKLMAMIFDPVTSPEQPASLPASLPAAVPPKR